MITCSKYSLYFFIDSLSNRKILAMSLKKLGMDAESAENGLIAVDMVKDELDKYTSIFMDFTMPIMVFDNCNLID